MRSIITFYFVLVGAIQLIAQTSFNSSGGDGTNSNGSFSYSVGQVFYNTSENSGSYATEGVQQPYEISVVSAQQSDNSYKIILTPNPTQDYLTLSTSLTPHTSVKLFLRDLNGKLLLDQTILSNETKINMQAYSSGVYFIFIATDININKEFKIIKN